MNSIFENPNELTEIRDASEIKKITLDILLHIKSFCDENEIRYYLGYGTLLGAIRHKGFIPWDDDIDILMPRCDYKKFIKMYKERPGRYAALDLSLDGYYYNYCKVVDTNTILYEDGCIPINNMGIYVDIFPLDGMPDEREKTEQQLKKLIKLRKKISSFGHVFPRVRKNIVIYFYNIYTYIYCRKHDLITFQNKYLQEVDKYEYEKAKYVYATGGAYGIKSVFLKKWFDKEVTVQFEGYQFPAPCGFDEMLHQLYDNYMELPSKDRQVSRHMYKAFYKTYKN